MKRITSPSPLLPLCLVLLLTGSVLARPPARNKTARPSDAKAAAAKAAAKDYAARLRKILEAKRARARTGKILAAKKKKIQDIIAWTDKTLPVMLKKYHVVGASVALVHQGRIVHLKGYGYSDLKAKKAVDPRKTLFRVGSISKLFTWTAVMQLFEEGKLSLTRDLNVQFRGFQIPKQPFAQPLSMLHLMAHNAGFEDQMIGLFTKDPKRRKTLKEVISQHPPKRVRPPGKEIAYSNYGSMLAGYLVEQLAHMPFETFIEKRIFSVLGMKHSSFRQPLPKRLAPQMSKGYLYKSKSHIPQAFEIVQGAPAGALSATAEDMAHFLLTHLRYGSYRGKLLLRYGTVARMHNCHFYPMPKANCFAHGFMEFRPQVPRFIGHGGDTIYFHSAAAFSHRPQFGFFISTNTSTGAPVAYSFANNLIQRFFPVKTGTTLAKQNKQASQDLSPFLGAYHTNRRSESDLTKLVGLFMKLDVSPHPKGGLAIPDFFSPTIKRFVQIGPLTFQEAEGSQRVVFRKNKQGKVTTLFHGGVPVMLFSKPPSHEGFFLNLSILLSTLLLLVSGFILRPTGLIALFSKKHRPEGLARLIGIAGLTLVLSHLIFVLSLLLVFSSDFIFQIPNPWVLRIPYLNIFLAVLSFPLAILAWIRGLWGFWGRVHFTLLSLATLAFGWFCIYWKLIG